MPRKSRIDAPGAVHHIIVRGIERGKVFHDDKDRIKFIERLGDIILETKTRCLAWALIPNHFHLLLKTVHLPIATVMRRLLTGYAVNFTGDIIEAAIFFKTVINRSFVRKTSI